MILDESKFYMDLISDFCSEYSLGKPPALVAMLDPEEFESHVGEIEVASVYRPSSDMLLLSPGAFWDPLTILHELSHHFQAQRDGFQEFADKYQEYLEIYGYDKSPYEIEADDFVRKWGPKFESFLKERLGSKSKV